jgi:hypothetical protein
LGRASLHSLIVSILVGVVVSVGALTAPAPASAAPTVEQVEALLAEYGSPMQGLGPVFLAEGLEHGVDPAFLVALTGAESSFGRFLYQRDGDQCTFNAFNWFYGERREWSDFGSWEEGIHTVAAGIAGRLYYEAGLVSVAQIGPRYCPEGTEEWLYNVAVFMQVLGGDPADTRYWRGGPPEAAPELLLFDGRVELDDGPRLVGGRVHAAFTIVNDGDLGVSLDGVRLVVRGPQNTRHDLGTREPLTLWPGEARRFVAVWPLDLVGRWDGWIEADVASQVSLVGPSQAFAFTSRLPQEQGLRRSLSRELRLSVRDLNPR